MSIATKHNSIKSFSEPELETFSLHFKHDAEKLRSFTFRDLSLSSMGNIPYA
jgi:hypothetical protein